MTRQTATPHRPTEHRLRLGDFTTDGRVLLLIVMAAVIGTAGAGAAWLLLRLINLATNLAYHGTLSVAATGIGDGPLPLWTALVPVVGCLIVGFMARYGSEKIRGHGIPEAMEAILIGRSRIQAKVALLKPLSSAISIGSGGPFGAEGPIIMTGGAIGSLFAQCFHLTSSERKTLLVAGAAAGMAATFGTPVAAVLLAVELLLFEWKPRSFIPVAAAAAAAAVWRPILIGGGALFPMSGAVVLPWWGIFACAGVGVASGLASGVLTALVYGFEDLFERLPIHWMWWPALGGVVIGLGGLIEPRALGVGYDNIRLLLGAGLATGAILRLVAVKAVIWSVALGSGTSGGVLAPLLIIGGALGALFGQVIPAGDPGFWALVGMAAIMGGTMRAPLTATLFAVELTHDFDPMLPVLVASAASFAVTVLLLKRSILTEKVARRGHHISREYTVDPFEINRVADIMVTAVDTLDAGMSVEAVLGFFTESGGAHRHKSYPVVDASGRLLGMVTRADVLRWLQDDPEATGRLDEWIETAPVVGYPDEPVGRLADRMVASEIGRMPIVERATGKLVGIAARKDLLSIRTQLRSHEEERAGFIGRRTVPAS